MSASIKVRKGTFKHVEDELKSYHDTRREIIKLHNEITTEMGQGGALTVLIKHRKLEHLQIIVSCIESVTSQLPDDKKRLMELAYWTKPQTLTWEGIAQTANISRKTAFRWRDEIIMSITERLGWR